MNRKGSVEFAIYVIVMAIIVLIAVGGPAGCSRRFSGWTTEQFGANWLVVQYSATGSPMNVWELSNRSIGSETGSDGIYFTDQNGNVVHLSGNYLYIQTSDFETAKKKYLKAEGK